MRTKPRTLKFDKYKSAEVINEGVGVSDGEEFCWPRTVYIDGDTGFNAKETKRLIKWLNKTLPWLEEKQRRK